MLVKALCGVTPKAAIDSQSLALVHLFETGGRSMDLLTFMIDYEFTVCTVPNTLFRFVIFSPPSVCCSFDFV